MENDLGEQLDGQFIRNGYYQIYRHKKADSAREQLEEWAEKTAESHKSSGIDIVGSVNIGWESSLRKLNSKFYRQIDPNAGDNEVNDNVDVEEEDKPSTSG